MGKNIIIEKFQIARLDEWIGDFESADTIYNEIQESQNELSFILKKSVSKRKEKLPINADAAKRNSVAAKIHIDRVDNIAFFQQSKLLSIPIQYSSIKWKYSVSIVSKIANDLRLEIRGYNPTGDKPKLSNLQTVLSVPMEGWTINTHLNEDVLLLEIEAYEKEGNSLLYLSIDQWGLLYGTFIVDKICLDDTLIKVHVLLSYLSGYIW